MNPYSQFNPMNYGYQPLLQPDLSQMYYPRYQPNLTGSMPQLSAPSSGDESKTVLNMRTTNTRETPHNSDDDESGEDEGRNPLRDRSFLQGDYGLTGRASYRNSFMNDITS